MRDTILPVEEVKERLFSARAITILTHLNPDADTLGTGLGIYALCKRHLSARIEIVNVSRDLPRHLDFLPSYGRIKHQPDFDESLLITCDGGSADRFGIDICGREVINIDHHSSNEMYGTVNVVVPRYASASQAAYTLFQKIWPISAECATCFYTALLSDTRYFTTASVDHAVFKVAGELVSLGADPSAVSFHLTQRRSLASLRILERALRSLQLYFEGQVAVMRVTAEDLEASGAVMSDMDGIVDYARSLSVARIGIFLIEQKGGEVRVSLRSKGEDVSQLAARFGGGGHKVAAGFTAEQIPLQEIIDTILQDISILGLTDGEKKQS
jgi:phosphoesterase RecJ-like protein